MEIKLTKLVRILIVVLGFLFITNAQQTAGSYTFSIISGTNNVEIIGYNEAGGTSVVIPSTLFFGRYTVTSIGDSAFSDKSLTFVSIPNSVTNIGDNAFKDNSLTSLTIGSGVTNIGTQAFYNKDLESSILTKVTSFLVDPPTISSNVFRNKGVIDVTIPGGSTTNYSASNGWDGFKSVTETFANGGTDTIDHIEYTVIAETTNLEITDYDEAGGTSVTIPETIVLDGITYTVISVGDSAFRNNSLTTVSIPNSVTTIGDNAFKDNSLTSLSIGSGVTNIGSQAFYNKDLDANSLTNVTSLLVNPPTISSNVFRNKGVIDITIPAGSTTNYSASNGWDGFKSVTETFANGGTVTVDYVQYGLITGTTNVAVVGYDETGGTSVTIQSSIVLNGTSYAVTSIADRAFRQKSLTSVSIPNSVTSIGLFAFERNSLTSVSIPNSVTSVGLAAFQRNSLASVNIGNSVTIIGTNAFAQNALTSVSIPNSVTSIGRNAFWINSLTSVTLGNSVSSIGDGAFRSNNSLTSVTSFIGNPPNLFANVFGNKGLIDLTIPNGTADVYTAADWTGFKSVTEETLSIKDTQLEKSFNVIIVNGMIEIKGAFPVHNVQVYNTLGQLVQKSKVSVFSVANLQAGVYYLKVATNKGVFSKKIAYHL